MYRLYVKNGHHYAGTRADRSPEPEVMLAGAVLRQAVYDAQGKRLIHDSASAVAKIRADAQAFLRDDEAMAFWCGLAGADVERIAPALWRAAGLDRGEPPGTSP